MKSPMARWLVVAVCSAITSAAVADDPPKKVDVSLVMLTEMNIAGITMDMTPTAEWTKPIIQSLESQFQDEVKERVVVVQVTLHKNAPAEVAIAGNPPLSDAETKVLRKSADVSKAPHSKVADCSFQILAKINRAPFTDKTVLSPPIKSPDRRKLEEFQEADIAKQLELMRRWARTEALPVLSAMAQAADPKFPGVRNLGKSIAGDDPNRALDLAKLTDWSPDYWRAMLEMAPENPLVPAIRVALHAANGEIASAGKIATLAKFFDGGKSGASRLLGEFSAMHDIFIKGENAQIQRGIALHDKGDFTGAIKVYDAVLKSYPRSAWAHFEKFQSQLLMATMEKNAVNRAGADWNQTKARILAADPLYPMMASAATMDELFDLMRRRELNELFKDDAKTKADLLNYTEIALDLEVYGVAGMMSWYALLITQPKGAEVNRLIEQMLYCQEKLGVKTLQASFKGDHKAEFAKIQAEQAKRKKALFDKVGNPLEDRKDADK